MAGLGHFLGGGLGGRALLVEDIVRGGSGDFVGGIPGELTYLLAGGLLFIIWGVESAAIWV